MKSQKKSKDWKKALLSSGLPLEHIVASILEKNKLYSYGEYSYIRENENNVAVEHSVDIDAEYYCSDNVKINFLIECKYHHPSARWIFYPTSKGRREYNLFEHGKLIKVFGELCPSRIDCDKLKQFESKIALCSKGIAIHGGDKNENVIKHGLSQLRYALPHQAINLMLSQVEAQNDGRLEINLSVPILVTTAQLFIINHKIDLKAIEKSDDLEEVATNVDCLIIYQEPNADWMSYAANEFKKLNGHPVFHSRLKELNDLMNEYTGKKSDLFLDLHANFQRLPAKILVVDLNNFEKILKKILVVFKASLKSYYKFAALKNDYAEHKSFFDTKTWFEKCENKSD